MMVLKPKHFATELSVTVTLCDNITRLRARNGEMHGQLSLRSWPLPSFLLHRSRGACSRLQESNVQRSLKLMRKTPGDWGKRRRNRPLPQIPRVLFSLDMFARRPFYLRTWQILLLVTSRRLFSRGKMKEFKPTGDVAAVGRLHGIG